ncbi:methyltransferase [Streptomyces sp. NPDC003011]
MPASPTPLTALVPPVDTAVTAAVRARQILVAAAPGDRLPVPAGWPVVAATEAVVLRAAPGRDPQALAVELGRGGRTARCYLDRIVLTAPTGAGCSALVPDLYDVLGEAYDLLVDAGRNIAAAEWALHTVAEVAGRPPQAVLDVGCGSGLSLRASNRPPALTGWDPSPAMRRLAAAAGMHVIPELTSPPGEAWDAALACYVLHLPGAADTAAHAVRLLRPGGVLVGNLHRTADPAALPAACARHRIRCRTVSSHPFHGDLIVLSSLPTDSGAA